MGFLRRLFGGGQSKEYVDKQGIYFYAQCDRCQAVVRVRADKQHDLSREGANFAWYKTIVDNRCFQRMQAVVHLNRSYAVTSAELSGGRFITEADYKAALAAEAAKKEAAETAADEAAPTDDDPSAK